MSIAVTAKAVDSPPNAERPWVQCSLNCVILLLLFSSPPRISCKSVCCIINLQVSPRERYFSALYCVLAMLKYDWLRYSRTAVCSCRRSAFIALGGTEVKPHYHARACCPLTESTGCCLPVCLKTKLIKRS
jgi:hypothetical protein